MSNGYFTVFGETENTIVIERSKFICSIKGIENEQEAKEYVDYIRKKYSIANHNCYAYIADNKGLIQKFSDAGEPQGTAGLPMLEVLKNKKMFKTVAVVTRYFGGIKLGTGGLTRAYGGSVSECLEKAKILNMQEAVFAFVNIDYDGYSKLLKVSEDKNVSIVKTEYENTVKVELAVTKAYKDVFVNKISDAFNGKLSVEIKESGYYAF